MLPRIGTLKFKIKLNYFIRKYKSWYCVRGDIHKVLSPEPSDKYSPLFKWNILSSMLIMWCIIYFQTQICIDFTNDFPQVDIPKVGQIFDEFPRDVTSSGGKYDFSQLENLHGQSEAAHLWDEKIHHIF